MNFRTIKTNVTANYFNLTIMDDSIQKGNL